MYTSEDINSSALYNLHYTGSAKKTLDSQEQYEAALARWNLSSQPSKFGNIITKIAKKTVNTVKASFNLVNASSLLAKQHLADAHLAKLR